MTLFLSLNLDSIKPGGFKRNEPARERLLKESVSCEVAVAPSWGWVRLVTSSGARSSFYTSGIHRETIHFYIVKHRKFCNIQLINYHSVRSDATIGNTCSYNCGGGQLDHHNDCHSLNRSCHLEISS